MSSLPPFNGLFWKKPVAKAVGFLFWGINSSVLDAGPLLQPAGSGVWEIPETGGQRVCAARHFRIWC